MEDNISVREIKGTDKAWVKEVMVQNWGSEMVITSQSFNTLELPGFIAEIDKKAVGVLTYNIENVECEIVSLNSIVSGRGVGTSLIDKMKEVSREKKCKNIKLATSNDNIDALKFYQKRGFRIVKIYPNAIEEARKIKPQIPEVGSYGIPIKDLIELGFVLS